MAAKQLLILAPNLTPSFKAYFNQLAAAPANGLEIIPTSIGVFNGDHPDATEEAFAEFWYEPPTDDPAEQRQRLERYEEHLAIIQGKDGEPSPPVIVIQSLSGNSGRHIQELEAIHSTLDEHGHTGPRKIVAPYMPYVRQDRVEKGRVGSQMGKRFPKQLHNSGFEEITTLEVHSRKAEEYITQAFKGRANLLSSTKLFADDLRARGFTPENTIILAPDGANKQGDAGQRRARELTAEFHNVASVPPEMKYKWMAMLSKVRTPGAEAGTSTTKLTWDDQNDVAGKHCVIVDDVGDSLGTAADTARLLLEHGALSVDVYLSHQGRNSESLENKVLRNKFNGRNVIDHITFTDSCPGVERHIATLAAKAHGDGAPKYPDARDRIRVLSTAPMFGATILNTQP